MQNMILVLHMLICVVLVGAVLMQRSEGGALGMGGGGTGGLISGRGAADMMVNITSWVGGAFFVTSVFLAVLASSRPADRSVIPTNGEKAGFHFTIPGLPKAPATKAAPLPTPAPVTTPQSTSGLPDGVLAPAPNEALTRAGPLTTTPATTAPVGTPVGAVRTVPPAAGLPTGTTPARTTPVGAATPRTTTPATTPAATQKAATTPAPMIPLPATTTPPATATESEQVPVPAPEDRQKTGPDQ